MGADEEEVPSATATGEGAEDVLFHSFFLFGGENVKARRSGENCGGGAVFVSLERRRAAFFPAPESTAFPGK